MEQRQVVPLTDKIQHLLEEIKIVIPGTQTLLGFQLTAIFSQRFNSIPNSVQIFHLGSIVAILLSVILLMMPAAYHRIVEEGNDSERFHSFASRNVLLGMISLAIGISIDVFVGFTVVLKSTVIGGIVGCLSLFLFSLLWFGFTMQEKKG